MNVMIVGPALRTSIEFSEGVKYVFSPRQWLAYSRVWREWLCADDGEGQTGRFRVQQHLDDVMVLLMILDTSLPFEEWEQKPVKEWGCIEAVNYPSVRATVLAECAALNQAKVKTTKRRRTQLEAPLS